MGSVPSREASSSCSHHFRSFVKWWTLCEGEGTEESMGAAGTAQGLAIGGEAQRFKESSHTTTTGSPIGVDSLLSSSTAASSITVRCYRARIDIARPSHRSPLSQWWINQCRIQTLGRRTAARRRCRPSDMSTSLFAGSHGGVPPLRNLRTGSIFVSNSTTSGTTCDTAWSRDLASIPRALRWSSEGSGTEVTVPRANTVPCLQ
mmetsp:Transcript_9444/g.26710  ORF Transcript_9444/g.26710 Transcript_9444/m.26710 type:complete len:204 (+) Transcript_9444:249-860(+)